MIDERDLREMLNRRVRAISAAPTETTQAVRRARRHLLRNGALAAAAGIAIVLGGFAGLKSIQAAPTPATPPSPSVPQTPRTAVLPTFDHALDDRYVIRMELLEGYAAEGANGVVFGQDPGQGISAWTVGNVYAKPCHWNNTLLNPPIGSSVSALVRGLERQQGRHATQPIDTELDGYAGKYLETTVPAGINVGKCDSGEYRTWVDPMFSGQRSLEAGQRDLLWIVDVDGVRLVIDAALGPQTTKQDQADRIQMVESIRIEPV
jgi:hypothetical protein